MNPDCATLAEPQTLERALRELDQVAPKAPFLALGQTIFWDEPMKVGVVEYARRLGSERGFVMGVHDTDYFAKLPGGKRRPGKFQVFPHNDTTTKGLWSAAAEFSALFGSETVVSRDALTAGGLRMAVVERARPNFLDQATEAWGWRGLVSLDEQAPITAHVPLKSLRKELFATLDWAFDASVDAVVGAGKSSARSFSDELRARLCDLTNDEDSLSEFFRSALPTMAESIVGRSIAFESTATTRLLKFNRSTAQSKRFAMFDLFVNQGTRAEAKRAYDDAIRGSSGLYELSRFGTGAIPFDLIIPGVGRGTIRLGSRGAVITTPKPQFLSFRTPLESVEQLADLIEAKFGPDCVVVGKAVALIGMLACEFVFMFHEGASGYVRHSRRFHQLLRERLGYTGAFFPILRIRYRTWDALTTSCAWLRLPEPFRRAFGTEELCAPSFARRWQDAVAQSDRLLADLGRLRRSVELIDFLDGKLGGNWKSLAEEYRSLFTSIASIQASIAELGRARAELYDRRRELRRRLVQTERAMGDHFRAEIFERDASPEALAEREKNRHEVVAIRHELVQWSSDLAELRKRQIELVRDPLVERVHERRREIELEAELKRLSLIREAVICARGLPQAARRPSAWWFPMVCPDGLWYRETIETAEYYLEPLD